MSSDIVAIQFETEPDAAPGANLTRAMEQVREMAGDAAIACLPEYFATPHFPAEQDPEQFDLAVRDDSEFVDRVRETAADRKSVV